MRKISVLLSFLALAVLLPLSAGSQTVNASYSFSDFTTHPLNVSRVVVTPLISGADYAGAQLSTVPLIYTAANYPSLTNGTLVVSNLISGYAYSVAFSDGYGTPTITNYFPAGLTNTVAGTVSANSYKGVIIAQTGGKVFNFSYQYLSGFAFTTNYLTITNTVNTTNIFNLTNNISGGTNLTVSPAPSGLPNIVSAVISIPTNYDAAGAAFAQGTANTNNTTAATNALLSALAASNVLIHADISTSNTAAISAVTAGTNAVLVALAAGTNASQAALTGGTNALVAALTASNVLIHSDISTSNTAAISAVTAGTNALLVALAAGTNANQAALVSGTNAVLAVMIAGTNANQAALVSGTNALLAALAASNVLIHVDISTSNTAAISAVTAGTNALLVALAAGTNANQAALVAGTNAVLAAMLSATNSNQAALVAGTNALLAALAASNVLIHADISTSNTAAILAVTAGTNASQAALTAGTNASQAALTGGTNALLAALAASNVLIHADISTSNTAAISAITAGTNAMLVALANGTNANQAALVAGTNALLVALANGTNANQAALIAGTNASIGALVASNNTTLQYMVQQIGIAEALATASVNAVMSAMAAGTNANQAALVGGTNAVLGALAAGTNASQAALVAGTNAVLGTLGTYGTNGTNAVTAGTNAVLVALAAGTNASQAALVAGTNASQAALVAGTNAVLASVSATNTANLTTTTNLLSSLSNAVLSVTVASNNGTAGFLTANTNHVYGHWDFNGTRGIDASTNVIDTWLAGIEIVDGHYVAIGSGVMTNTRWNGTCLVYQNPTWFWQTNSGSGLVSVYSISGGASITNGSVVNIVNASPAPVPQYAVAGTNYIPGVFASRFTAMKGATVYGSALVESDLTVGGNLTVKSNFNLSGSLTNNTTGSAAIATNGVFGGNIVIYPNVTNLIRYVSFNPDYASQVGHISWFNNEYPQNMSITNANLRVGFLTGTNGAANVRPVFAGFYLTENQSGIVNLPTWMVRASIEYPSNTFYQMTQNGNTNMTILSGQLLVPDDSFNWLPPSCTGYVRAYFYSPNTNAQTFPAGYITQQPEGFLGQSLVEWFKTNTGQDQTTGGDNSANFGYATAPCAIIGLSALNNSVGVCGSSIYAAPQASSGGIYYHQSFVTEALINYHVPFIMGAMQSSKVYTFVPGGQEGLALSRFCRNIIAPDCINDIVNNTSFNLLTNYYAQFILSYQAHGCRVFLPTPTPYSSSSNGFTNELGQTALNTNIAYAITAWIRTSPYGVQVMDVRSTCESASFPGCWKEIGTNKVCQSDGIHPVAITITNMEAAVSAMVPYFNSP